MKAVFARDPLFTIEVSSHEREREGYVVLTSHSDLFFQPPWGPILSVQIKAATTAAASISSPRRWVAVTVAVSPSIL